MPEHKEQPKAARKRGLLRVIGDWLVRWFMPDDDASLARQAWLERRLQSALITLLVAGVIWGVTTLSSAATSLAKLTERIDTITIQLDGTYRADVAQRDVAEITRRLDAGDVADRRHETEIEAVARRVDRVEYVIEREHHLDMRSKPAAKDIP